MHGEAADAADGHQPGPPAGCGRWAPRRWPRRPGASARRRGGRGKRRAQRTEIALGALLGAMLLGLSLLIRRWHVAPNPTKAVLAQLTQGALGHNAGFFVVRYIRGCSFWGRPPAFC